MDKILVVVDMQEGFKTAEDQQLLYDINKTIRRFKEENQYILILEYLHKEIGKTFEEIKKQIKGYKKSKLKKKTIDDGSEQVIEFIVQNNLHFPKIYICGVNTSCCIRQTAESLCASYNVTVLENLCRCCIDHSFTINKWERLEIINIERG